MEIQARQLLVTVFGIVIVIGFANAVQGETAASPVVVGLAKCSDCARRNMNAEAAFKGLQVAVKCKNSKGDYESKAVGHVDKTGAFSVPLAADAVGEDGKLKSECFAQLHSASTAAPCPGQEPSMIIAAPPGGSHDGTEKTATFVALGGKVHSSSSPECASAFLCHHFFHSIVHHHLHHVGIHTPVVIPHLPLPDHGHGHFMPPAIKPPAVGGVPEHKPAPVSVPEHKPPSMPTPTTPSTPVYSSPKPTPIYHPPAQRDAVTVP